MTASDYSVTFPYGETSDPYSPASPHRGDDYPCPQGTLIVIGSTTIGTTGATGFVFGAHLHVQEWQGNASITRKPQNAFKGGTVVNLSTNKDQGSWGRFITIHKDGWNTTYAHLDTINVSIGQVITEEQMINDDDIGILRILHSEIGGWDLNRTHAGEFDQLFKDAWRGHSIRELIWAQWNAPQQFRNTRESWRIFYDKYASLVGELNTRPTKADYEALVKKLQEESSKTKELTDKLAEELAKPPITNTVEIEKKLTISDHITAILSYIKGIFKR